MLALDQKDSRRITSAHPQNCISPRLSVPHTRAQGRPMSPLLYRGVATRFCACMVPDLGSAQWWFPASAWNGVEGEVCVRGEIPRGHFQPDSTAVTVTNCEHKSLIGGYSCKAEGYEGTRRFGPYHYPPSDTGKRLT